MQSMTFHSIMHLRDKKKEFQLKPCHKYQNTVYPYSKILYKI